MEKRERKKTDGGGGGRGGEGDQRRNGETEVFLILAFLRLVNLTVSLQDEERQTKRNSK